MSDFYLFRSSIRDLVRFKRLVVAFILISLPSLLALFFRLNTPAKNYRADEVYAYLSTYIVFQFILVILAVVFATGSLSQEIEQKTIVYLLTRPVPRWRILLAKFAASLVAIIVTVCLASVLLAVTTFSFGGADSRSALLTNSDLHDVEDFTNRLKAANDPMSAYLWNERLPLSTKLMIEPQKLDVPGLDNLKQMGGPVPPKPQAASQGQIRRQLVRDFNDIMQDKEDPLYSPERFAKAAISTSLRTEAETKSTGEDRIRINRLLLETAYPQYITHIQTVRGLIGRDLLILPLGALAYGALFLLFATVMRRPLIWGLVFAFGWESWTPSLPDKFQMVSLMAYLRTLAPHDKPDAETVDVTQLFSGNGAGEVISNLMAWSVLLGAALIFLTLALSTFSNREYVPREDAE